MSINMVHHNNPEKECGTSVDITLINSLLEYYTNVKGSLIPVLQGIQDIYGYLPKDALLAASKATGSSMSTIYGVATFYAQFRLNPSGKNIIRICHGTACHVQNVNAVSEALIEELGISDGETTSDSLFTLETVACLGCCSLAPVMMIGDEAYGNLTAAKAVKIIKGLRKKALDKK